MRIAVVTAVLAVLVGALATGPIAAPLPEADPRVPFDRALNLAGLEALPEDVGLIVHADFPARRPLRVGDVAYTAITLDLLDGKARTVSAIPRAATAPVAGESKECSDPAFAPIGKVWRETDLPVQFAFTRRTLPGNLNEWQTVRSLRLAHDAWEDTNTHCSEGDPIDFHFHYVGFSRVRMSYDGINAVDFGRARKAVGLSYIWYRNGRILEADLRLNKRYPWTNRRGVDGRYQVMNVVTHELGHHVGLDDLGQPHGRLTMFGRVGKGEMNKVSLGRGDVKGAQLLSP